MSATITKPAPKCPLAQYKNETDKAFGTCWGLPKQDFSQCLGNNLYIAHSSSEDCYNRMCAYVADKYPCIKNTTCKYYNPKDSVTEEDDPELMDSSEETVGGAAIEKICTCY